MGPIKVAQRIKDIDRLGKPWLELNFADSEIARMHNAINRRHKLESTELTTKATESQLYNIIKQKVN